MQHTGEVSALRLDRDHALAACATVCGVLLLVLHFDASASAVAGAQSPDVQHIQRLAEQGDADAQYNLGGMYFAAVASRKTTPKLLSGSARPPSRGTPMPITSSVGST